MEIDATVFRSRKSLECYWYHYRPSITNISLFSSVNFHQEKNEMHVLLIVNNYSLIIMQMMTCHMQTPNISRLRKKQSVMNNLPFVIVY